MTCYYSPTIVPGKTWSGYHANITLHRVIDGTHADVTVLPSQGSPDRFIVTEDLTYNYPGAVHPFSFVMPTCMLGTFTTGVIKCKTCDIEPEPEEAPNDILGLIAYIKDKIIELITTVAAIVLSLGDIGRLITGAQMKIDEAKNLIGSIQSNINYELDVLEIKVFYYLEFLGNSIITPIELYKKDILDALDKIGVLDPTQIIDSIKLELIELGDKISNKIIEDIWDYIEYQIFEKED